MTGVVVVSGSSSGTGGTTSAGSPLRRWMSAERPGWRRTSESCSSRTRSP